MKIARHFSFSDRIRYYWTVPEVQKAFTQLINNFGDRPLPLSLLSQYLPGQYADIRAGCLANRADDILLSGVNKVLDGYFKAV